MAVYSIRYLYSPGDCYRQIGNVAIVLSLRVAILGIRLAFVRISNSIGLQKADALLRKNPIWLNGEKIDLANWQQRIGKCQK